MKQRKVTNRSLARAVQITATCVVAMSLKDTMMATWITVAEYAKFVGISKTSARASLKLATDMGLLECHQTGLKAFFYEPVHPHLRELVKASRDNESLQSKIRIVSEIQF